MVTQSESSAATRTLLFFVHAYQRMFSPYFGSPCRFTPSCSHYAVDALIKHGSVKGSYLALRRLLRCHPWRLGGYDPVP